MTQPVKIGRKIAVSVMFDVVSIEIHCGDEYAAQVTYDDLVDRLQKGEGLTLSVEQRGDGQSAGEQK